MGAQPDPNRQSLPPPGTVMGGRYRLTRLIAAGGMGAVYEAADQGAEGRPVALKLLHPELTTERDVRRRFRRESSVLLALDHACIVRVLDVGTSDDELLFTVMELLDGETLHERLERTGQLDAEGLAPIVEGMAQGMTAAHEHGVIHGDLKPANVFLLAEPGDALPVKLLDFGLSKVLGLERLTRTGELIGTPAYMAPELLTGKGELDERIDTYAIGVILYQCLAGHAPFRGKVPGKLMMDIVMGQAPPLSEVASEVPPDVAAVVSQAMSRQRERRFGSAAALARAYHAALGSAG
ncbi:MAG TPA: serine/threonine-protein kinase [Sandaracinaceae bacterium LLY-WYZ-13_1]|nr:serine/threonine-protein kinase [Sandaracinaceae bacterium LLY-WYZ-13_1]